MSRTYGNAVVIDGGEVSLTSQIDSGETALTRSVDGGEVGESFMPLPQISIGEVETLPPDEEATATMTGTASRPILNLGLVKGQKGDKGDKGDAGALNSVTATVDANVGTPSVNVVYDGANAEFNFHNLKGIQGETGPQGIQGIQGIQGERGPQGEVGPAGPKGDTGGQGPKGDTGSQGPKGDTGTAAGFGTVSATVDANVGTPSVSVTASGSDTAKNFVFEFHNLKGATGPQGPQGDPATNLVQSVNGQTGTVSIAIPTVPTDVSAFTNDVGYLTLSTLPIWDGGVV